MVRVVDTEVLDSDFDFKSCKGSYEQANDFFGQSIDLAMCSIRMPEINVHEER